MPQNKGDAVPARAAGANAPEPASRLGLSAASTIAPGTPLPWSAEFTDVPYAELGESWTIDAEGNGVATLDCPADEREANARFIVHACNAHGALVEALQQIANGTPDTTPPWRAMSTNEMSRIAKAALTLALGEQS